MCGGPNVTPATQFRSEGVSTGVGMNFQAAAETWSSRGRAGPRVGRARACLDCGHVMLFLGNEALNELRQGMGAGWRPLAEDE